MDRKDKRPVDPVDLLNEHYEAAEMSDEYRRAILAKSRNVVASRWPAPVMRWAACLAGTAAVAAVLMVMTHHRPYSQHPPKTAKIVAPVATDKSGPAQNTKLVNADQQPKHAPTPSAPNVKPVHNSPLSNALRTAQRPAPRKAPLDTALKAPKPSANPVVAVTSVTQPATDASGHIIAAGDRLPAGMPIRTGRGGRLSLVTPKGSELHLDSNSELTVSANAVATISRGRLYCRNRNHEIARIDTPAGCVKLLGTVVDTAVVRKDAVAVTVVEGKVQLSNRQGAALVDAGHKALLVASRSPEPGRSVDTYKETTWYHGRRDYQSDFGEIAYTVSRGNGRIGEIWTANIDGTNRRRIRSYVGWVSPTGEWLPGEHWLMLQTNSLIYGVPDAKNHIADKNYGSPIVKSRIWLLNVLTGQDMPISIPEGHDPYCVSLSPDARLVALNSFYYPKPGSYDNHESGIWVYDIETGDLSKVFDSESVGAMAWAPDSRKLVVSLSSDQQNYDLTVVDTKTHEAQSLKINGAGASFSPDGTRLTYCGDFKSTGRWIGSTPTTGSIFVVDLAKGGEPLRLSPAQDDTIAPCWSPDGHRIAYIKSSKDLCIVNADGSGLKEIYHSETDELRTASWAPKGNAIYTSVVDIKKRSWKTLLVAADGSGIIATIDGSEQENKLPPACEAQTEAAAAAIGEAVFQYAMGPTLGFEGDLAKRLDSYRTSASIFTELLWKYPLSGLSPENIDSYVQANERMAAVPADQVLQDSCGLRMKSLGICVIPSIFSHKQFAPDLDTLMDWGQTVKAAVGAVSIGPEARAKTRGMCPGTPDHGPTAYIYTPPADGSEPKIGDVLIKCPLHPEVCYTWGELQNLCLHHAVISELAPGSRTDPNKDCPYSFENVGTEPLTVLYHVLSNTYEIKGTARLLSSGKTYSNETVNLADLEAK